MSEEQPAENSLDDPEKTFVLVHANCGHNFPVPLARLADGQEFDCPVCGEPDRIDQEAVNAAREQLEALRKKGPLDTLGKLVAKHLPPLSNGEKNDES